MLQLAYYTAVSNIGDRANGDLIERITGRPVMQARTPYEPHVLGMGSTLSSATAESLIWGTGMLEVAEAPDLRPDQILALRGEGSRRALEERGVSCPEVPLGDPGVLAGSVLGIAPAAKKTHTIGLVPHYVDWNSELFTRLDQEDGTRRIDVREGSLARFLADMSACEVVVSSSLHGLVFAESLSIPAVWVEASGKLSGGRFKFDDWFSTCMRRPTEPVPTDLRTVLRAAATADTAGYAGDAAGLISALRDDRVGVCERPSPAGYRPLRDCRDARRVVFQHEEDTGPEPASSAETWEVIPTGAGPLFDWAEAYFADWAEPAHYLFAENGGRPDAALNEAAERRLELDPRVSGVRYPAGLDRYVTLFRPPLGSFRTGAVVDLT